MGNFSRDSFKETNVLNNLLQLSASPVVNPRHYVGVRMQQGVPVLDADWNELEDLRRMEVMALLRFFIGSGVPAGTQAFRIVASATPNTFNIDQGLLLTDGHFVVNPALTTYTTQPNAAGLPPLTTPGADRSDLVYLDTWDEETDSFVGDPRLINDLIGIETAVRIERKWAVRVQQGATAIGSVPPVAGHKFQALALLRRRAAAAVISADMIVDLRRTGITLAENIKVPMFMQLASETVDAARFAEMLRALRLSLFGRLKAGQLPHQTATTTNENILLVALQDLMNRAQAGEVQAAARNFNNEDGLAFLGGLYDAQKAFLSVLSAIGNVGNVADGFASGYTKRLDGSAPDSIRGLKLFLDNDDLIGAVIAQEAINLFLSEVVNVLPEGTVDVLYKTVNPFEPLSAAPGSTYTFSFDIESHVGSPNPSEDFDIVATLSAPSWGLSLSQNTVTLTNMTGKTTVTATVTPNAAESQATLRVKAVVKHNHTIESPQPGITLQLGVEPPVGTFFFYADAKLNLQGQIEIPRQHLARALGREINFKLRNESPTQTRVYRVVHSIKPTAPEPTAGWSPLPQQPPPQPPQTGAVDITVNPSTTFSKGLRVDGPKNADTSLPPKVGTTGEIVATATLINDGAPVINGPSVEVHVNFIVI